MESLHTILQTIQKAISQLHWTEGGQSPCTYSSITQEVPEVCLYGRNYQYRVLPFGLSSSSQVFTKILMNFIVALRQVDTCVSLSGQHPA